MNSIKINKFFNLSEFVCPCCGSVKIDERLVERLTRLRKDRGRIIIVKGGGYRCPAYQIAIKLAREEMGRHQPIPKIAAHPEGKAGDVTLFSVNTGERIPLTTDDIPYLMSLGFNGIGIGQSGWAHLDIAHTEQVETWSYGW